MRNLKKIAVINLKGGVGKSVTVCNLASILGWKYSRRVLVMDLDKQANTSKFFRCFDPDRKSMAEILTMEASIRDVVRQADASIFPGVEVVPSCMKMLFANQRVMMNTLQPRHNHLSRGLYGYSCEYDYCIMDCPPDIDMATANALACADWVIIPVDCGEWAMDGLNEILDRIQEAQENYNPELTVLCVLPTMYRRTRHGAKAINALTESGLPVFRTEDGRLLRIDSTVKVQEAISEHLPLHTYSPKSSASVQYLELARNVVKRTEGVAL